MERPIRRHKLLLDDLQENRRYWDVKERYMFRTVPLFIIRSLPLHTRQWYMSCRCDDSLRAGSGRNCSY